MRKILLTVSYGLRGYFSGVGRCNAASGIRAAAAGSPDRGRPGSRPAGQPPGHIQHLKVLKEAGLVTDQAHGTRRFYRIEGRGVAGLRDYLQAICAETEVALAAEIARQLEERRYG